MSTKRRVLELLERYRDTAISGTELAGRLDVSRNAVWKAVRELEREGYRIEAVTNRGYRLLPETNILSAEGMLPFLWRQDLREHIHVHPSLPSTSQTAKELAIQGAPHGTAVLADAQSAGRGRMGKSFYSPPGGGIYCSVVLRYPSLSMPSGALVTTAAAVAVCRAIRRVTGKEAKIKWVNDLYLEGKKICGILTEAVTDFESGSVEWLILGVGLNFSTRPEQFPPGLRDRAGSVCPGSADGGLRNRMAAELLNAVLELDRLLFNGDFMEEYRQRSLVLGKQVEVQDETGSWSGLALDITPQGHLTVRRKDGRIVTLRAGEVLLSWF